MKKILLLAAALILLMSCHARQETALSPATELSGRAESGLEHSPTTLIIMCDSAVGKQPLRAAIERSGASIIYDYSIICGLAIRKPDNMPLEQAREYFRKVEGVLSVEYDHIIRLTDPVKPRLSIQ